MLQNLPEKMDMIIDMDKIPLPDISSSIEAQTIDCGAGVYMKIIQEISKEEYYTYLETLKSEGYEEYTRGEEEARYRIRSVGFRKEQQIVTVTYNGYWNRVYITSYIETEPQKPNISIEQEARNYGAGNYVTIKEDMTLADYRTYQIHLQEKGFVKYVDNEPGLFNKVFTATYIKEEQVITVTYIKKTAKLYISACENLPLSKHLHCDEESCENSWGDRKTSLHMLQMKRSGNSFLFQLKNGHFIISDGGFDVDLKHLVEYVERQTPHGEKPIIDAWFISHGHSDHCGIFRGLAEHPNYAKRIYVEGIYFNEPNDNAINLDPETRESIIYMKKATQILQTVDGKTTQIFRPQTGQRYYFDDIVVDIIVGQEQLTLKDYSGDFNDSSTWCLFNIEGQKCLLGGDGDSGGIDFILRAYEPEDMHLDVFTLLHHGHNTRDRFTDFCMVKTVLDTSTGRLPEYRTKENEYLKSISNEWISWKDGTKVLEFPYEVGNYKSQS